MSKEAWSWGPQDWWGMTVAEAPRCCLSILAFSVKEKFSLTESKFNKLKIFSPDKSLGTLLAWLSILHASIYLTLQTSLGSGGGQLIQLWLQF